jgi:hypothetical protein
VSTRRQRPSFKSRFDLDIPLAIQAQLVPTFSELAPAPLGSVETLDIPSEGGVYGLFREGKLVYVGKADNLHDRIAGHAYKLSGRLNINMSDMQFVSVVVNPNWAPYAPEALLIRHFRQAELCEWNGMGFGPNDPGVERDTQKPSRFDLEFPINTDAECGWAERGTHSLYDVLRLLKRNLPYLLRFEMVDGADEGHPDFTDKVVRVPRDGMTAMELFELVARALPAWELAVRPGYVTFYSEPRPTRYSQHVRVVR